MNLHTKDGSNGFRTFIYSLVDKTGTQPFLKVAAGQGPNIGSVVYGMQINYTGTAGFWLSLYDTAYYVGQTGSNPTPTPPTIGTPGGGGVTVPIWRQIVKASGLISFLIPLEFRSGILAVATSDYNQTTNPDQLPEIVFMYT